MLHPIAWVLFVWSAIGILWIGAELVSAQSNVACGSQPSEAHCFGYHDRCHWDDGDIEQAARCADGPYCSYLTNATACATEASAFRCRWDDAGGWCGARVLPSLQACSQVGIAFRGGDLFAAGLEMGYERRILFANETDRVRSAASTHTLVDATHACFDAAAAFERGTNDTSAEWEGLASLLANTSLADWHPAPGVYEVTASELSLSGTLTFDAGGDPSAFWVFRVRGTLRLDNVAVQLLGGARQGQVTWVMSHDLPLDVVDAAVPSPTSTPTRLVGTFLFLADDASVRLDGPQPIVSGAFLSLGTRASFLLGSGGVVFGDTPDACAYYGRNATLCLDKDRPWMSCMLAPVTGLCTNLDCPATFAKTGLCPTNRCRLSANNKFCADSLPCSRAMTRGACTQLDPLRCDWREGETEGEGGVCVQRALPPFPPACEGFGAIFNGTDRRMYVAGGVTATGSDGGGAKRGQLVAFAPPVGINDTGSTDMQYDPAHVCFAAMAAYRGVFADTSAWPIRTSTGPSSPDAEWLLVPGVHRRIVPEVAPRTAVVFDAQSDPSAFWVVDVRKLTLAATTRVHLRNGAEAGNIVWLTSEGGAELFAPFVPGTVIDTSERGIQIGGGGGDAPPTVDGRVVALHPDASLVLPGAVLGLDGSCYAHRESAAACRASPRRCTYAAATRECLPTPCFADALSADSCPLDRCRLAPFGTTRAVCASGLQCSFAQTAEQCETQYGTWKDCRWTDGACVEALRSLPTVSECGPYSVVVRATTDNVARVRGLDLGERAMITDVRPADFDTITPAQLAGQAIIDTSRCTLQMRSQLGNLDVIVARIPQRPTPVSWSAGVVLRRGTYVLGGSGFVQIDGQIVFDAEGDSNAYWVIYATSAVSFGAQMQMRLVNRAQQRNIFWVGAVDSVAGWSTADDSMLGLTSPLLGTFVQMPGASSWVQFRGRKIAGRVLSATPNVDLSGSSFVDSCYMIADRVGCAASVTPLCSFDEFSGTCAPAPCGDPRWTGATTAASCPANRCRRAGEADAGGEGGRTCIDGADCAVFRTAAGCQSPSAPRCKWSAATGKCSKKRLDTGLAAACEAIGVAFQGTNEDDFRMNGVYMGNNRSIVATTLRFGTARTLRSYLRDPAHPCFGALERLAADMQDRAAWPTSVGIDTSAPHIAVTLKPGVYDYARLPFFLTSLTFDAGFDPDAYWILRVPSLMFAETLAIALVNRAQMRNIVWVGVTEGATWSLNAPFIPGIFVHPKAGATVTMQSRIKMGMLATLGATSKLSIQHSIFVDSSDELLPVPEVRVVSVEAKKTSLEDAMMVIGPIAIAMVGVGVFGYLAIVLWKARAAKAAIATAATKGRATRLKALQKKEQKLQQQQAQSPPVRDLYRIALL